MQKLKAIIKSVLRPILLPIALPILHRVRRFTGMRDELDNLHASWHQNMPGFVNAAASVAALAREQARTKREHEAAIAQLRAALEQMRGAAGAAASPARILAADKLERARAAGLKLLLGCGPLEGYVHADTREAPGVDIVSPLDALPLARAEASEILACHVLERCSRQEFEQRLLPHWVALLKPGGTLRAVVLDTQAMIAASARGEYSFEDFRDALFGAEAHRNMFTAESLGAAFRAAGLTDVQVLAQGRRQGKAYELEIAARVAAN